MQFEMEFQERIDDKSGVTWQDMFKKENKLENAINFYLKTDLWSHSVSQFGLWLDYLSLSLLWVGFLKFSHQ